MCFCPSWVSLKAALCPYQDVWGIDVLRWVSSSSAQTHSGSLNYREQWRVNNYGCHGGLTWQSPSSITTLNSPAHMGHGGTHWGLKRNFCFSLCCCPSWLLCSHTAWHMIGSPAMKEQCCVNIHPVLCLVLHKHKRLAWKIFWLLLSAGSDVQSGLTLNCFSSWVLPEGPGVRSSLT